MATTAEGQHDGVTAAGPDNKYDGAGAHPEVDNTSALGFDTGQHRQSWQTGNTSTSASSGFALGGNRPD